MREILFRGKRIDNGEWVYGYLCVSKGITQIYIPFTEEEEKENEGHIFSAIGGVWQTVIPETVGQYTGLTDKNGKKIFEGDVVKVEGFWELAFVVIYYNGGFKLKEIGSEDLFAYYITETMVEEELIEVIGNTNDNPELLKGGGDNAGRA